MSARFPVLILLVICGFAEANAQERLHLRKNAFGFHPNSCGNGIVQTYAPSAKILEDTQWLAQAAGLTDVQIRQADIKQNACALMHNGQRYILFGRYIGEDGDPEEKWALDYVVLAHEVGHLACKHTGYTNDVQANWNMELAADRYSGMLIRGMVDYGNTTREYAEGFLLSFAVDVMARGSQFTGGWSHPPDEMRRRAVREGYNSRRGC
jgi:hypothetical protein